MPLLLQSFCKKITIYSFPYHFANITFKEEIHISYEVNAWVRRSVSFRNSREISQNISTGGLTKRLCGKARSSVADVYSKMAQLQFL